MNEYHLELPCKQPKNSCVITNSIDAAEIAESIYKEVSENGGEVYATHIFPRSTNKDLAIDILEKINCKNIELERILIFENVDEEIKWVEDHFTRLDKLISKNLWIIEKYPLQFTRFSRTIFPRANILLYKGTNCFHSLIGLDNIHLDSSKTLAFYSEDESSYYNAKEYFNSITGFDEIISVRNVVEYQARRFLSKLPEGIHDALTAILNYGESNRRDIAFIGLFGTYAKIEKGVYPKSIINNYDSDVDIIIVLTKKNNDIQKKKVKNELSILLEGCNIVWGDDDDYFYEWRDNSKINIDIEIRSLQSQFYLTNKLLGFSIFKFFTPLFSQNGKPLRDFMEIPLGPLTTTERQKIVLNDRKGLLDFKKCLSKNSNYDPRRVLSHLINNISWAEFGQYPATVDLAIIPLIKQYDVLDSNFDFEYINSQLKKNSKNEMMETINQLLGIAIENFERETKHITH